MKFIQNLPQRLWHYYYYYCCSFTILILYSYDPQICTCNLQNTYAFMHSYTSFYFKYRPYHICKKKKNGASKRNRRGHRWFT